MPTIGVFGLPGAGKSTFLAKCARRALAGKTPFAGLPTVKAVYSTFPVKGCYKLDFDDLGVLDIRDSLIIIDEISLLADARDFKTFDKTLKSFFALHRHYGCCIIWCSQYATDCDKRIRNITDRFYLMEKAPLFLKRWFTVVKPIARFMGVADGEIADKYELAPLPMWSWCFRPRYYRFFDSFECPALKPHTPEFW